MSIIEAIHDTYISKFIEERTEYDIAAEKGDKAFYELISKYITDINVLEKIEDAYETSMQAYEYAGFFGGMKFGSGIASEFKKAVM